MDDAEVRRAAQLYAENKTLVEVRLTLRREGYPSRSVNTISAGMRRLGYGLRRPGRRPMNPSATTI
jgi:hypothetical protein